MICTLATLFVSCRLVVKSTTSQPAAQQVTLEEALKNHEGVHPRVMIEPADLESIRKKFNDEAFEQERKVVLQTADATIRLLANWNPEKLNRQIGSQLANLTAAYAFGGDEKYFDAATKIVDYAISYGLWHRDIWDDLIAGHMLFAVGLYYDWCYDDLSPEYRQKLADAIFINMQKTVALMHTDYFYHDDWLGNHLWLNITAVLSGSLAIYDHPKYQQNDDFKSCFDQSVAIMDRVMGLMPEDGSNIEGLPYNQYGLEYLLKYIDIAKIMLGKNYYNDIAWVKQNGYFQLHNSLPVGSWSEEGAYVTWSDTHGNNWYGPSYLLRRIASEYNDPYIQWLANETFDRGLDRNHSPWYHFLGYNPDIEAKEPSELPSRSYFDDIEIITTRSGWQPDASLMTFKCGPFLGHKGMKDRDEHGTEQDDWGGAHTHQDANHISIFAKEWLLTDDGYSHKYTSNHNTLVFHNGGDTFGQFAEGETYTDDPIPPSKALPRIIKQESNEAFDYMVGDATTSYKDQCELRKFLRHVIFIKPNAVIVYDQIEQEKGLEMELRFFTGSQKPVTNEDGSILFEGQITDLLCSSLRPSAMSSYMVKRYDRSNKDIDKMIVGFTSNSNIWENCVAFTWADKGSDISPVSLKQSGEDIIISINGKSYKLSPADMVVTSI